MKNHMYIEKTKTSVYNKMLGHLRDQLAKLVNCLLYRHDCESHNGVLQQYVMAIIASKKIIVRLNCLEGLHIEMNNGPVYLSERNERWERRKDVNNSNQGVITPWNCL